MPRHTGAPPASHRGITPQVRCYVHLGRCHMHGDNTHTIMASKTHTDTCMAMTSMYTTVSQHLMSPKRVTCGVTQMPEYMTQGIDITQYHMEDSSRECHTRWQAQACPLSQGLKLIRSRCRTGTPMGNGAHIHQGSISHRLRMPHKDTDACNRNHAHTCYSTEGYV